jgi:hypothetical protein
MADSNLPPASSTGVPDTPNNLGIGLLPHNPIYRCCNAMPEAVIEKSR